MAPSGAKQNLMEEQAGLLRLCFIHAKAELSCYNVYTRNVVLLSMPDVQVTSCKQATLLGAPVGSPEVIGTIAANIDKLTIMGERLLHLPRQDALLILRYSLAVPRLLFILRTAPCFLSTQLKVLMILGTIDRSITYE